MKASLIISMLLASILAQAQTVEVVLDTPAVSFGKIYRISDNKLIIRANDILSWMMDKPPVSTSQWVNVKVNGGKITQPIPVPVTGSLTTVRQEYYYTTRRAPGADYSFFVERFGENNRLESRCRVSMVDSTQGTLTVLDAIADKRGNNYVLCKLRPKDNKTNPMMILEEDTVKGWEGVLIKFDRNGNRIAYRKDIGNYSEFQELKFKDNYLVVTTGPAYHRKYVAFTQDLRNKITDPRILQRAFVDSDVNGLSYTAISEPLWILKKYSHHRLLIEEYNKKTDLLRRKEIILDTIHTYHDNNFKRAFDLDKKHVLVAYATSLGQRNRKDMGAELHLFTVSKKNLEIVNQVSIFSDCAGAFRDLECFMIDGDLYFDGYHTGSCKIGNQQLTDPNEKDLIGNGYLVRVRLK